MKFMFKQIIHSFFGLILITNNAISEETNSNKCTIPSSFLELKLDDLIKLDECFEKDKKASFQNILENPKTKKIGSYNIEKYLNETMLNHHTKDISDENYERLFNASLKYINETKFLKWFLYKEKTSDSLIRFAENHFKKDPLVTTTIFEHIINNNSDITVDNLKKVIAKYLPPKKLNNRVMILFIMLKKPI